MTTATPGKSVTLLLDVSQWSGGPPADVTGLAYAIGYTSGAVIVPSTSADIVHLATGVYSLTWAVPAGQASGDAIIIWTANEGQGSEQFTIGSAVSSATGIGACSPWPATYCTLLTGSAAVTGALLQAASDILYELTAKQFGLCTFTFRPCRHDCNGGSGGLWGSGNWWQWGGWPSTWPQPFLFDGLWYNLTCGQCAGSCSCTVIEETWLPSPVHSVVEVKLNGVVMSPTQYRIDDFRKLVRTDGGRWPFCQNMVAADTEDNTWSVTVEIGQEVPVLGQMAVGELANYLACPSGDCNSGQANATTITRQGMTFDLQTIQEELKTGLLGLKYCDLFIATYNPDHLRAAPMVYDVDGMDQPRRVGTA